jgi:ribonuclease-3
VTAPLPSNDAWVEIEQRLGYRFRDRALLQRALTHPSWQPDPAGVADNNQRLEFLGDAVLNFVIADELFRTRLEEREGRLTQRRAALIRGPMLADLALELGLDRGLRVGRSEEAVGRTKSSALEDAFEAVIGAIYLDSDLGSARAAILRVYGDLARRAASSPAEDNPKGALQERVQPKHGNHALRYELVGVEGADHARTYEVAVFLHQQRLGVGRGTSKQAAETAAARAALTQFPPDSI